MTQSMPPQPPQFPIGYGYPNAPRRSNGPAIASLVLGILGCIPLLTGLLAILFGILGIRKSSRDPSVGGNGMAIAGLILGVVSVLGWTGLGGTVYIQSKPSRTVARQFLQDVAAGNINAAMANSTGFTAAQLQTQNAQMTSFGALQSIGFSSFYLSTVNGQATMQLGGTATFANGSKTCSFDLVKIGGSYKVKSYSVQ